MATADRASNVSPAEIKKKLETWKYITEAIIAGLEGDPFSWTGGERESYQRKAQAMGVTLVTKTQIARLGHRLKRGAKPVGCGYFFAPISKDAALYVLECQAVKDD